MGYVQIVETDVTLAIRSLSLCKDAVSSRAKLIETFELGTLIFARLAESCSSMSIQSTTPQALSKSLQEYFGLLNDLNESLAGRINAFLTARNEEEISSTHLNLEKGIQELESIILEISSMVQEERASIERHDYYQQFLEEIDNVITLIFFFFFEFFYLSYFGFNFKIIKLDSNLWNNSKRSL